jgi:hypothetical protein
MILSYIIQIVLCLLLLVILLFIGYYIYNYENLMDLKNSTVLRKDIIIFDGIMNFKTSQNWQYNTYNKSSITFKDLTPSINQNGGAEYTYNFWLKINKNVINTVNSSDIVLLLRGSKIKIPYINNTNCEIYNKGSYILLKNPLIRMKSDGSAIIVEYNTLTNPDAYRENGNNVINCASASWYDKNKGLLGIYKMDDYTYNNKWFMFTVVLREITPENDILYKNKTSCKIYINGLNTLDRIVESPYNGSLGSAAMKHNRGALFVNPGDIYSTNSEKIGSNPLENVQSEDDILNMANLTYHNYALDDVEILNLFKKEFTKSPALPPLNDDKLYQPDKYAIANVSEQSGNFPLPF